VSTAPVLAGLAVAFAAGGLAELSGSLAAGARAGTTPDRPRPRGRRLARGIARLGRAIGAPQPPADLALRLDRAGAPGALSAGDVMALKGGAAAIALLGVMPLAAALPGRLGPLALVAAPAGGFLAPDLWLRRRTLARRVRMEAELPAVLELLLVAVEAGLPPARAMGEVGRRHAGLLARELSAVAARVELGVARERALAGLVRRCPFDAAEPLVAAIARADRHGVSLGPALAALAADARARRAQALQERAARAAPKIQLVVALLLVPAAMLVVGAALAQGLF
jgi:tight adherence protein C